MTSAKDLHISGGHAHTRNNAENTETIDVGLQVSRGSHAAGSPARDRGSWIHMGIARFTSTGIRTTKRCGFPGHAHKGVRQSNMAVLTGVHGSWYGGDAKIKNNQRITGPP